MLMLKRYLPWLSILFGATIIYLIGSALYLHAAHAAVDGAAATAAPPAVDITTIVSWGAAALGVVTAVLHLLGVLSPHNSAIATLRDDFDRLSDDLAAHRAASQTSQTSKLVPPSVGGAALLALVVLGAGALTVSTGCSTVRPRAEAATQAFLDCEDPSLKASTADLLPLGEQALLHLIDPTTGKPDPAKLKSDAAGLKTDLGHCLFAAAAAALATPPPVAPAAAGETTAARVKIDGPALLSAAGAVRAQLGWTPVRLADGTVL